MAISYIFNNSTSSSQVPGGIFTIAATQPPLEIIATSKALADVGLYVFTIPVTDGQLSVSNTFTLNITNTHPEMIKVIANSTVRQKTEATYNISEYFNDVDTDQLSLGACFYSFNGKIAGVIPSSIFVEIDYMNMLIFVSPTQAHEAGDFIVTVKVTDSYATTSASFNITVPNSPPRFTKDFGNVSVPINSVETFNFTEWTIDEDENDIFFTFTIKNPSGRLLTLPSTCFSLVSPSILSVAPALFSDLGDYLVDVEATDTVASSRINFTLTILNTPPYFLSKLPTDFTMSFNLTYRYLLPRMKDDEGNQISVQLSSVPAGVVKFSEIKCCSGEEGE
jgi:hypothetical protein